MPLDLAINSWIKSSNKAISGLMAGLIPIASDTPNYRIEMEAAGLEHLLFDSPAQLDRILAGLDPTADSVLVAANGIVGRLIEERSPESIASQLREIVTRYRASPSPLLRMPLQLPTTMQAAPPFGVWEHLQDFGPSVLRGIKRKIRRGSPQ